MSAEGVVSLTQRLVSLEDIIRQQEHTISAVLHRLRDVEQYAAAESHNREKAQQELYALLSDRGGSTAETVSHMQELLRHQNERLSALQAEVQGQGAALRGVNDKHDAAFRGMEQRLQADTNGAHHRAQASEAASAEAIRAIQAQLQSVVSTTQTMEARNHDSVLALQQQMSADIAVQRQRSDNLESAIRDALHDVHTSLSDDVKNSAAKQRGDLEGAMQRINQELESLDQRVRIEMKQLHDTEQTNASDLQRRIAELASSLNEMVQAATSGLVREVAQVAQHIQMQDKRQETAHQAILQELAKHDSQLETVDLNWRASVTDLSAKMREDVASTQHRAEAGDQALQSQIGAAQERFVASTVALRRDLTMLTTVVQEKCVKPLQEAHHALSTQEQRMNRIADDYASMQDYLRTFVSHVDKDMVQLKQVFEAAVRSAHSELVERINLIATANAINQDPENFRAEVNRGLGKLWEDAKNMFLTQRSLGDIEKQLATLESAVRVELCTLADQNKDIRRTVNELRVEQLPATQTPGSAITANTIAPERRPSRGSAVTSAAPSAVASPVAVSSFRVPQDPVARVQADIHKTSPEHRKTAATAAIAPPWSSMPARTSGVRSEVAKVEEIHKDSDECSEHLGQPMEDKQLRGSLQRLRIAQAQEFSKSANATERNDTSPTSTAAAVATEAGDASAAVTSSQSTPFQDLIDREDEAATREAEEGGHNANDAMASIMSDPSENSKNSSSLYSDSLAAREGSLIEVTGLSTGKVFRLRQSKLGATSPVFARMAPTIAEAATMPARPRVPSELPVKPDVEETAMTKHSPGRGSSLPEVLLPTSQFVRKREYANFKDFTKREIDTIWVELLNIRRTRGLSKDEMLLYVSQNRDEMVSAVLKIVQQQGRELLEMLASMKARLSEMEQFPLSEREICRVPIDSGQHVDELVRSLAGCLKGMPEAGRPAAPVESTLSTAGSSVDGGQKTLPRPATHELSEQSTATSPTSAVTVSRQLLASTPLGNQAGVDTTFSSALSSMPMEPQFISPIVHRHTSHPTMAPESEGVLYASINDMDQSKPGSSPVREQSQSLTPTPASSANQHHTRQGINTTSVNPQAKTAVSPLSELESISSHQLSADAASKSAELSRIQFQPPFLEPVGDVPQLPINDLPAAASTGPRKGSAADRTRHDPLHADCTSSLVDLLRRPINSSRRGYADDEDVQHDVKGSKSPCSRKGGSVDINPLHGVGVNNGLPPRETEACRVSIEAAVPGTASVAQCADNRLQLLAALVQPETGAPEHQSHRDALDARADAYREKPNARRQTIASLEDDLIRTPEESDTYSHSTEDMWASRSDVRRQSADAGVPTFALDSATPMWPIDRGHLYEGQAPTWNLPQPYAPPHRFLSQVLMPKPQPCEYIPLQNDCTHSVPTCVEQPHSQVQMRALSAPGAIHLGPHRKPADADTPGGFEVDSSAPGVRNSLRLVSSATKAEPFYSVTMPSNAVVVRVLDDPVSGADKSRSLDPSSVVTVHPHRHW